MMERIMSLLLCLAAIFPASSTATTIFVKYDAVGDVDGTSWGDAYTDLQSALAVADSGDTVLVAAGTYTPTQGTDRTATFALETGVGIFGGFTGTESSFAERDIRNNTTVLSGAIGSAVLSDNSYHVVTAIGVDATAVLDGFYITGGYAYSANDLGVGGGMFCDGASPTIRNVQISFNEASNGGGMLCRNGSSPLFVNVAFTDNSALLGGAMLCQDSSPRLVCATVTRNSATVRGGAFNHASSSVEVVNAVLWDNRAPAYPLTFNSGTGQPSFGYSLVQGSGGSGSWDGSVGADLGNNIDVDAELVDCAGSVRMESMSPAIDAGDGTVPELLAIDLSGHARITGAAVDMGAYEFGAVGAAILYVDVSRPVSGDGLAWSSAFRCLQEAITLAGNGVTEVWVAEGTYFTTAIDDSTAAFRMADGVDWYGGFSGVETMPSESDPSSYPTILSGETGDTSIVDNALHVVIAEDLADTTTTIDGFTITRGNADGSSGDANDGGGMLLENSNIRLSNLNFTNNAANVGGGLNVNDSEPRLTNVRFVANTARYGGAIALDDSPTLLFGCTFVGNSSTRGGAAHVFSGSVTVTFDNCEFIGNTSSNWGGALTLYCCGSVVDCRFENNVGALGGAILVNFHDGTEISNSTFVGNFATGDGGGAIYCRSSTPVITHCTFENNSAANGGAVHGWRSVELSGPWVEPEIIDCVFFDNHATELGGAVNVWNGGATVVNSSFFANTADSGGAIANSNTILTLYNSVLWGDTALTGDEIFNAEGINGHIEHCLIAGSNGSGGGWDASLGTDFGGNIDVDPLYANAPAGDLHIGNGSLAVDAGTSGAPFLPTTDLDGNPRIVGVEVDMGAYEYDQVTSVDPPSTASALAIRSAYPNPFNPSVTIEVSLDRRRPLAVDVFDVRGRLVRTLAHGDRPAGLHRVTWDGRDRGGAVVAAGVYFVAVRSHAWHDRRKIVLVK